MAAFAEQALPGPGPPGIGRYASLYRGGENDSLGGALARMVDTGRSVVRSERARWQSSRLAYRGDQWIAANPSAGQVRVQHMPATAGRKHDTFNRLRQMTDGRVALLSAQRPPFEVVPASRDQDVVEAAKQGTRLVSAKWGAEGWAVDQAIRELVLAGEIDGVAFLAVIFDPNVGKPVDLAMTRPEGPRAGGGAGPARPITNPAELEALRSSDPDAAFLWQERKVRPGEVAIRVVRPGAIFIDPFAVTHFADAKWIGETRVRPRSEVERQGGRKLSEMVDSSRRGMGMSAFDGGGTDTGQVSSEEPDGATTATSRRDACLVHEVFIAPHGPWPQGAHVVWIDQAPGEPLVVEPWDDDLPYMAYVPRPDGGHFLRSRSTVDDLRPIQVRFNRLLALVHEWLDKVARPPLLLPIGAMRDQELYNERGYVELHLMGEPHYMQVPPEPAALLTNHLQWCVQQMSEVANLPDPSRGVAPGRGVESAAGLAQLSQNAEQQLSGPAARLVSALEWAISRALKLVGRHYSLPRLVSGPGIDDEGEFRSFTGAQLRGCTQFRITGQVLPKLRAQQLQTLMQLAPMIGPDAIRPYIARIIDGDIAEFVTNAEAQTRKQRAENQELAAVGRLGRAQLDLLWSEYQADAQQFAQALGMAQQMAQAEAAQQQAAHAQMAMPDPTVGANGNGNGNGADPPEMPAPPPPVDPLALLASRGIKPPRITDRIKAMGVPVVVVEDFDDDPEHLRVLDLWRLSDGFRRQHEVVRQYAREHAADHQRDVAASAFATHPKGPPAPATGSPPAPKGQPSPPRQRGEGAPAPAVVP